MKPLSLARWLTALGVTAVLAVTPASAADIHVMISAGFHENGIDFMLVWNRVHEMLAKEAAPNIEFYPAGRVMLIGWVYYYGEQAAWIFLLSFALITIAHVDYMRSLAGAATPLIACALSAIWGVGAGGWMGLNLEPLTLVVPVLLIARALSHSLQMTRRYYEILYEVKDKNLAAGGALADERKEAHLKAASLARGHGGVSSNRVAQPTGAAHAGVVGIYFTF